MENRSEPNKIHVSEAAKRVSDEYYEQSGVEHEFVFQKRDEAQVIQVKKIFLFIKSQNQHFWHGILTHLLPFPTFRAARSSQPTGC